MPDSRKFCASISVRAGQEHSKIEIAPAEDYGGQPGFYRLRVGRRWLNGPDGQPRFFDRASIAKFAAETALSALAEPAPRPDIPQDSRVTVRVWKDDFPEYYGTWTYSEPILDYSGRWLILVSIEGKRRFVPCEDVIPLKERRHARK